VTSSDPNGIVQLTQELLDSIDQCDWPTYQQLCDETLTAFEPEAVGNLVEGMSFHEFYLAPATDGLPRRSTITSPHIRQMGDVAVLSYVRLLQTTDPEGLTATHAMEETRVWQLQGDRWQHVHFHRSPTGSTGT